MEKPGFRNIPDSIMMVNWIQDVKQNAMGAYRLLVGIWSWLDEFERDEWDTM